VRFLIFPILLSVSVSLHGQTYTLPAQRDRWSIQPDGSIEWRIDERLPHSDHIEMSGEKVSLWIQYGVDTSGKAILNRTLVFPTFRLLPQRTISSMMYNVTDNDLPRILIGDRLFKAGTYNAAVAADLPEKVTRITLKGIISINSQVGRDKSIILTRTLFPSVDKPMALEKWVFINTGKQAV
jgi:hypothetical protein